MKRTDDCCLSLNGEWQLSFTEPFEGKRIETVAEVPCNTEPILQKLGLVDEYMPPDTPHATTPFTAVDDWCFTRTFDAPDRRQGWRRELVFEGIDTVAEVYLNGERVLDCQNMHMTYTLDVTERLHRKGNVLHLIVHKLIFSV